MYEKPKVTRRNHLRDTPKPKEFCGIEGCHRHTTVYIKEYDVSRCSICYQRDLDIKDKSANPLIAKAMIDVTSS